MSLNQPRKDQLLEFWNMPGKILCIQVPKNIWFCKWNILLWYWDLLFRWDSNLFVYIIYQFDIDDILLETKYIGANFGVSRIFFHICHQDQANIIEMAIFRLSTVTLFKRKCSEYRKSKCIFTNTSCYHGRNLSRRDFAIDHIWFLLTFLVWWFYSGKNVCTLW